MRITILALSLTLFGAWHAVSSGPGSGSGAGPGPSGSQQSQSRRYSGPADGPRRSSRDARRACAASRAQRAHPRRCSLPPLHSGQRENRADHRLRQTGGSRSRAGLLHAEGHAARVPEPRRLAGHGHGSVCEVERAAQQGKSQEAQEVARSAEGSSHRPSNAKPARAGDPGASLRMTVVRFGLTAERFVARPTPPPVTFAQVFIVNDITDQGLRKCSFCEGCG